jgi:serine/threonine protein kinase
VIAGRYRLQETLSATVMAEVWSALDPELDRQVVVKLLAPEADRSRFEREAQAAAGLAHPNIVHLFDYGEDGGRPYMVFEYLAGGSLEDRLAAGPGPSDSEVERIAAEIAAGLAHAHDAGIVHRDLKPGNVLFDAEGRAKIADFGIAQLSDAETLTEAGTVLGTAAYMSPEQASGEAATPASDVYSFGVVLYRMLAGRLPFEANNPTKLAAMHRTAEPPPLSAIRPDVPPALAGLTMSALAKQAVARPGSGAALVELLTLDAPPSVPPDAETRVFRATPPRWRSRVRMPIVLGVSTVLLALFGVAAAVLLVRERSSSPPGSPVKITQSTPATHAATAHTTSTSPSTRPATSSQARTTSSSPSTRSSTIAPPPTTAPLPAPPPTISDTTATTTTTDTATAIP